MRALAHKLLGMEKKSVPMNKIFTFLFPYKPYPVSVSAFLLLLRLLFGGLIMWHGITKIINFDALAMSFPDPLAFGHKTSLVLAIFAEAFCGLAVVAGFIGWHFFRSSSL